MMFRFERLVFIAALFLISLCANAQVTFVIYQLPQSTPQHDTIFIAGSFNNWNWKDPAYMLQRRLDGKFAITLPASTGTIEYKFNRGGWLKWETDARNNHKPNRSFTYGNGEIVLITIENWQDAGGAKSVDYFVFFFFAIAMASALIALLMLRIKNPKRKEVAIVMTFLGLMTIALLGRVAYEFSSIRFQLPLEMAGDLLLFVAGPIWFFTLNPTLLTPNSWRVHAILPLAICLFLILKIFNFSALDFLTKPAISTLLTWDRVIFFGLGLISTVVYFFMGQRKAKANIDKLMPLDLKYLKHIVLVGEAFASILSVKLFILFGGNENLLSWFNVDFLFLAVSANVLLIGYYVIRQEDVFRFVPITLKSDELESLKATLHETMMEKKAFKDPHLTLNQLSEIVNIKPHMLSKIINEGYQQNFRDFVNKYRVEEFIALAKQDTNKKYTFLALASEVGFNSKSTFNVAFKKVFQQSPRDFFKDNKMLEHFKKDQESLVL